MGAGIHGGFGNTKGSRVFHPKENNEIQMRSKPKIVNSNGSFIKASEAKIAKEKLLNYALNPHNPIGKHKAKVFETTLGYNQSNYEILLKQIKGNVGKYKAIPSGENEYGKLFKVIMPIRGINSKTKNVVTGWIVENGSDCPKMTTVYVQKEK